MISCGQRAGSVDVSPVLRCVDLQDATIGSVLHANEPISVIIKVVIVISIKIIIIISIIILINNVTITLDGEPCALCRDLLASVVRSTSP